MNQQPKKECCEECDARDGVFCLYSKCPCHKETPSMKDEAIKGGACSKCGEWKGGSYGMNGAGEQSKHVCMKDPNVQKEWESCCCISYRQGVSPCLCGCHRNTVKLLTSHNNSLVSSLEKAKRKCDNCALDGVECDTFRARNETLTEAQELIKNSLT